MASSDFPNSLPTNTFILHDYSEIAFIVCTGAIPAVVDRSVNNSDVNSRDRVLARLKNARHQFRQASILVVLDIENLELITFYKKADIVKDQQAILTKFGNICKLNACKIERKNACRVVDLVKPDMARVWNLFSEAVLSSLTLRTPGGKKVQSIGAKVHLVPKLERSSKDEHFGISPRPAYCLCKADLQVIIAGHLLLVIRNAPWPPLRSLAGLIETDSSSWKYKNYTTMYMLPTGQLARYAGGWIGMAALEEDVQSIDIHTTNDEKHRLRWFTKVREWLGGREDHLPLLTERSKWCTVEIPVTETVQDSSKTQEIVLWKTVVWPVDLIYVFQDEDGPVLPGVAGDLSNDPLAAAQNWYLHECSDARAAAAKDISQVKHNPLTTVGHFFDDDAHFGSPQQFMNVPAQAFPASHAVYPTPPEAINPQFTGMPVDGIAQTPVSLQQTQPSIYQSSPLATINDLETAPTHESSIANFLQNNNDDLFEDAKLNQPSFADEPNWDFFDRVTTTTDLKGDINFGELNAPFERTKTPDASQTSRLPHAQADVGTNESPMDLTSKDEELLPPLLPPPPPPPPPTSLREHQEELQLDDINLDIVNSPQRTDTTITAPPKEQSFARFGNDNHSETPSELPSAKRRRSSIYDVLPEQYSGHDHKYGPQGKYHFELTRPSISAENNGRLCRSDLRASSSSSSSQSSQSQDDSDAEDHDDPQMRSWTRYEPTQGIDTQTAPSEDGADFTSYDAEVDDLLGAISAASGDEPFTISPPSKLEGHRGRPTGEITERYLMVAQILAEQLTQSSVFKEYEILQLPKTTTSPSFDVFVENGESGTNISNASIGELASVQPPDNSNRTVTRTVNLEPDRIRIRQAEGEMTADVSIVKYWETLNLQPLSGPKNIRALCLHPEGSNYFHGCHSFMRRMRETYTACNLGSHSRLELKGVTDTGLLAWNPLHGRDALFALCRTLGKAVTWTSWSGCIVVYAVLPTDELSGCVEICDGFVELYETLGRANHVPDGDIVLQLVPSSFVVDLNNPVVRPQKHYVDLGLEVYNRIPSAESLRPFATAGIAVLEKPVGRSLHFELSSKTSSPLFKSGHCYHLGYCLSEDERWLVASWSDAVGHTALTTSYCLIDEQQNTRRPRADVFRHMWETSGRLLSHQKGQPWLAVAKVGGYDAEELQEWLRLYQQTGDEHRSASRIVLLSVELQCRLAFQGAVNGLAKQSATAPQLGANALNTPVTTPQAIMTSPDQNVLATPTAALAASAQTPPDLNAEPGSDGDAYLSDPLNESWMVTFAFAMSQAPNLRDIRSAQTSGFLLKRAGAGGMAVLCVNLIAAPRKGGTAVTLAEREQILQDVLVQYRGLHLLAVVRRCADGAENCVPWHIATAFKGAQLLERLM